MYGNSCYKMSYYNGFVNQTTKITEGMNPSNYENFVSDCLNLRMPKIKTSVNYGIDVNKQNNKGITGLQHACRNENIKLVEYLVEHGANPDIVDVCANNMHNVLNFLLENCSFDQIIINECLEKACRKGNTAIIETFIRRNSININFDLHPDESILSWSLKEKYFGISAMLIERHAYIKGADYILISKSNNSTLIKFAFRNNMDSILINACEGNEIDVVEAILEGDVDTSKKNNEGDTGFIIACKKGYTSIVELFIKGGYNLNRVNDRGMTGLIIACMYKRRDIISLLCQQKIDINQRDNQGKTAFFYACYGGALNLVKILINAGADTDTVDDFGNVALDYAKKEKFVNIVEYLENIHNRAYI